MLINKDNFLFDRKKRIHLNKKLQNSCFEMYEKSEINKYDVYKSWLELSIALCCENLTKSSDNFKFINGISISPKKTFCIIKIWNNDKNCNQIELLENKIQFLDTEHTIYKAY